MRNRQTDKDSWNELERRHDELAFAKPTIVLAQGEDKSITKREILKESSKIEFAVKFQHNLDSHDNIPLQINLRPITKVIAINTLTGREWGQEQNIQCSFLKDDNFDKLFMLEIEVLEKYLINIYVNGQLISRYECKRDITKVEYLCLSHGVSFFQI
ncbi:unnamed protein product [Mytilus coruscus]|uniref:Galectin n=1 Tax=Mytilus coruscus TaxID=42192 RepID=A0A6J8EC80_MYTCO|nr:unnamed protein product [Mytilus coruscus]